MGKSQPPPQADVDLVHSYARVRGTDVEILLARPKLTLAAGDSVVLRREGQRHEAVVSEDGEGETYRLVVRCPRAALQDGTWAIRLVHGETRTSLGCRLLVQGQRPPVLLWGSSTRTSVLPTPHPRGDAPATGRGAAATARATGRRALRAAGALSRRVRRSG